MQFSSEHHLATKKPRHKQVLGKRGEAFAARYLRERGAEIIAANVSYRVGEWKATVFGAIRRYNVVGARAGICARTLQGG